MRSLFRSLRPHSISAIGLMAVTLAAGSALATTTVTGVQVPPGYDSFTPPSSGGTYVDPVFGTTIKRVTNALGTANADQGGNLTWIESEYSTANAFNNDNSKFILLHQSYFGLYAGDGTFIGSLPMEINSSSEPRWGRNDLVTLYYHSGHMLKSYNVASGNIKVVHLFSEYTSISGNGEMDMSLDGDHMVFAGDNRYIFVYQISADKKFSVFDTGGRGFDSLYITPQNKVIVSWYPAGSVRFTGQELFDTNMNFLRQVGHADGHKHLTKDTNGAEVLIWTNSADPQPIANCQNGIVKILLSDASQTCLTQLDWSLAVHITAPDGNGYAFVETYAPSDPMPGSSGWTTYTNELLQVKLDGSGVSARLAHHRSQPRDSYLYMPKMTVSRDGSRILYGSNFDLQKVDGYTTNYADTYMILLNGTLAAPAGSTTTSPATATSSTVRYEQTDPSVAYTGTWYPNGGAFNSGGTAAMAMAAGSKAQFSFTGTSVKWIGFSDPWSGIAHVYVDGSLRATIDTYSAVQQAQKVQYAVSNLSNAAHTIQIVPTGTQNAQSGGAWVWVDAFDVTSSTAAPAPTAAPATPALSGLVQQDNAAIQYTGTWFPNLGAFNSGGSAALATDAGSKTQFTFTGTAISWIGFSDPWSGIAQVYIDGTLVSTVDTYSATQKSQAVEYAASGLALGSHTITIAATGTRDNQSAGSWIWVDAFNVTPSAQGIKTQLRATLPAPHALRPQPGVGLRTPAE
jgi:hypothetical protein